jgi:nucleoside-diphosphate-sugar epimerase
MPQSRASAEVFHSVNVRGTENVLSAAVGESARRFVYASTVEVYGIPDHIPCAEDAPKKLLGVYSRNKLDCEELGTKYSADFGLEVVMMRMPMLLGPGFYHDKFFVKLLDDLGRGKPLYIVGNGENRHQMVACSDVVEAYLLAAELPSAAGEAFNIASDPATVPTVREMAEQAIARLGSRSKVKCVNKTLGRAALSFMSAIGRPLLMDEHRELAFADYVFDIEKAKNLLGYAPRKDNVDAIVETAQWRWKDQGLAP